MKSIKMKKTLFIYTLLVSIAFSSCNQVKLENNEAEALIKKALSLPKSYREDIGQNGGTAPTLDALQVDGLITYSMEFYQGNMDYTVIVTPTEKGAPYFLGKKANNTQWSDKFMFKTNDIDFDQITGISIEKESQIATVRFTLKATNITPIARTLARTGYLKYSLDNALPGELIFKKFDNGWQLQSDQNKSSNDIVNQILGGRK